MEFTMTNGFTDLSTAEMEYVSGGSTDWGAVGYKVGKGWCDFWGNVGGGVYTLTHPSTWFEPILPYNG